MSAFSNPVLGWAGSPLLQVPIFSANWTCFPGRVSKLQNRKLYLAKKSLFVRGWHHHHGFYKEQTQSVQNKYCTPHEIMKTNPPEKSNRRLSAAVDFQRGTKSLQKIYASQVRGKGLSWPIYHSEGYKILLSKKYSFSPSIQLDFWTISRSSEDSF